MTRSGCGSSGQSKRWPQWRKQHRDLKGANPDSHREFQWCELAFAPGPKTDKLTSAGFWSGSCKTREHEAGFPPKGTNHASDLPRVRHCHDHPRSRGGDHRSCPVGLLCRSRSLSDDRSAGDDWHGFCVGTFGPTRNLGTSTADERRQAITKGANRDSHREFQWCELAFAPGPKTDKLTSAGFWSGSCKTREHEAGFPPKGTTTWSSTGLRLGQTQTSKVPIYPSRTCVARTFVGRTSKGLTFMAPAFVT